MIGEVEFPPEHLHPQQRENDNEEEEEEEQRGDGAHRVQKRSHEVTQRGPVPVNTECFNTAHQNNRLMQHQGCGDLTL